MSTSCLFQLGQQLRGKAGTYRVTKQLSEFIYFAVTWQEKPVVIKKVDGHWRLHNERDILNRFEARAPNLRPLLDEIEDPPEPPAIVLRYLDDDVTRASRKQRLTRQEIKNIVKTVVEVLQVLYADGYVHTDVKPSNILLINLIWGLNFHIFKPEEPEEHEMYDTKVDVHQHQWFGQFPIWNKEIADEDTQEAIIGIMSAVPPEKLKPFQHLSEREICSADKAFMRKIIRLDPRDRPSTRELLHDEWFTECAERTVGWYSKDEWQKLHQIKE